MDMLSFMRRFTIFLFLSFAAISVIASPLHAQSGLWKKLGGPDGGNVVDIVIAPNGDTYVEGYFGYYIRMTGEQRFQSFTEEDIYLQSVAVDSIGNAYAASGDFVCRIKNGVVDFDDSLGRPFKGNITQLRILPNNVLAAEDGKQLARLMGDTWITETLPTNAHLMAAKADSMFAFDANNIYTRVGKKEWASSPHGLDITPTSVALSPWGILVSTSRDGVFLSPFPYDTLVSISDNLPDWLIGKVIYADGCIIAGGDNNLYTTSDLGATWIPGNDRLKALPILTIAAGNGTWYAGTMREGLFTSVDKGQSWQSVNGGISESSVTAIVEYQGEIWTGSNVNAVHAYNPVTEQWFDRNAGMRLSSSIEQFLVVNDTLYAIDQRSGLYRWHRDSLLWTKIPLEFTISSHYSDMVVLDNNTLIVISEYPYRVNLTTWGWERLPLGLFPLHDIERSGDDLYISSDSGVFYSSDRGNNWSEFLPENYTRWTKVHKDLIFIRLNEGQVIRSHNNGATWDTLSGSPRLEVFNGVLYAIGQRIAVMSDDGSSADTLTPPFADDRESFYFTQDGRLFGSMNGRGLFQFIPSSSVKRSPTVARSSVYPNPSSRIVYFGEGRNVVVLNALGQQIFTSKTSVPSIDVSQWSDGVYFYSIDSGDNVQMGSFIVQH